MPTKGKGKILAVEDQDDWQDVLSNFFSDDYDLYPARTLLEALDLLERYFFHVAIVDLRLIEEDLTNWQGLEVVKRIWQLKEGTQTIVLTGKATPDTVRTALLEYSVFDSVEKQKQGSDTEFMRNLVARAAEKAQRMHLGRIASELSIATLIPASLCGRDTLTKVLQVKALDKLQWSLEQVFQGLYPVRLDPVTFHVHEDEGLIQAVYWSKTIGMPVLVIIGREGPVSKYRPSEVVQGGVQRPVARKHTEHIEPPLISAVYELEDADLEHFFDLPLPPTFESRFGE